MNDICNSVSQCREYYAEELAAAAAKATPPTMRSIADLKRDDYEAIAKAEEAKNQPSLAKRFAKTALEVLNYGLSVPREKAMP